MPAQATKSRSGFCDLACEANGVKSVAVSGTSTLLTVCPREPSTAATAAKLPWPNAESCAKTVIFLPTPFPRISLAARMS